MSETKEEKKEKERKTEFHDIDKPIIMPSGISVAAGEQGIVVISIYSVPPETEKQAYVISRIGLTAPQAAALSKSLENSVSLLKKDSTKRK